MTSQKPYESAGQHSYVFDNEDYEFSWILDIYISAIFSDKFFDELMIYIM